MAHARKYITLDIGGSGGRCVVGSYDGNKLTLEKVGEFENSHVRVLNHYYWDVLKLFSGIKDSLKKVNKLYGKELVSLGVDTMGVNFALLDSNGELIGNPFYTRVPQKKEILNKTFNRVPRKEIYGTTGLQLTKLNSLYHLAEMVGTNSPALKNAKTFLMLPDLINYWLTGKTVSEYTIASTSHLLDASKKEWALDMIKDMGIPTHIFPEIIKPGNTIGKLHPKVAEDIGIHRISVAATASHDTAAALACVPAEIENYAYLSSGTWGMLGCETSEPILTEKAMKYNFANEGSVLGNTRFIYNSVNLWILKECKRIWELEGRKYTWDELINMAEESKPFLAFIDPQWSEFLVPENMPKTIQKMCSNTGQNIPETKGEIVRVIIESLALKYRYTFDNLTEIIGRKPEVLHIVGGGGRNKMLSRFTANAINVPVITGPYDATAVGNIIMQMIAVGDISSYEEGKELIRKSFPCKTYLPALKNVWEEKYQRYRRVIDI
ncbi:rhamnulokinase family protein [Clostridium sediminicola]|uniref:rhamnulokinase n=1 Tax=Clostridium sediminicola TaxID=3114879 RepID=UPI0031F230C9